MAGTALVWGAIVETGTWLAEGSFVVASISLVKGAVGIESEIRTSGWP